MDKKNLLSNKTRACTINHLKFLYHTFVSYMLWPYHELQIIQIGLRHQKSRGAVPSKIKFKHKYNFQKHHYSTRYMHTQEHSHVKLTTAKMSTMTFAHSSCK